MGTWHFGIRRATGYWQAAAAGLLFLAVFAVVGKVWRIHLHIPLDYSSDAFEVLAHLTHNYISNDVTERLFAPLNAMHASAWQYAVNALFQFNGNLMVLCRWLTGDDAAALNLYFLLTFPLTFGTAYYACWRLRLENPYRFCVAMLYAFMPYHLWRGEIHILESTYLLTPLYILVLLRLWAARPLFWRHDGNQWQLHLIDRAAIGPAVLLLFFGSFHYYHQFFFAILAGFVGLGAWAYRHNWRHFSSAIGVIALALMPLVLKGALSAWLADPILHLSVIGYPLARPGEDEYYPLKIIQLLLPVQHHRWEWLAHFREVYDNTRPLVNENSSTSLGLVGALGFAVIVAFGLQPARRTMGVLTKFGWVSLVILLVTTMGGLNTAITLASQHIFGLEFPLSQARGWNRIVIYLGFFAYFGFFVVLRGINRRVEARWSSRHAHMVAFCVCTCVLIFALWDQVPKPLQQTKATKVAFKSDQAFFGAMEAHSAPGASVFQLPVIAHHVSGSVNGVDHTEGLRPFISTKAMRFSFGADYGSAQLDLLHHIEGLPTEEKLRTLCEYGLSTILIHRNMYADPKAVEDPLAASLNVSPVQSADGAFSYLPLDAYCANHAIRPIGRAALADRLAADAVHYEGTDFLRQLGSVVENGKDKNSVVAGRGAAGYLTYGPYRHLPPGSYDAVFHLTVEGNAGDTVGGIDVDGVNMGVAGVLAKADLTVGDARTDSLTLHFSSSSPEQVFEFRVFVNGRGQVTLHGVDVQPVGKKTERR
ncbi:hypothetical protein [Dyella silvae]|uniref:hypothetical protein n=1 Tax=Dyella silvae TaxID=2994424 RepID=UPI002264057B|nr:hypothetical protein [Dyella silvae]